MATEARREHSKDSESDLAISFEFFPPKTAAMEGRLWETIKKLEPLDPRFVSVTYGADGGTRARTHGTVTRILRETRILPAAHRRRRRFTTSALGKLRT